MESILTSIKKLLGITEAYEHFDSDIVMHINTSLSTLSQLGVGPSTGFFIEDKLATWNDFVPNSVLVNLAKQYVYLKVRLVFDPPQSSTVIEAMNRQISELEWRMNVEVGSTITKR